MMVKAPQIWLVTNPMTDKGLALLREAAGKLLYYPDEQVPQEALEEAEAWLIPGSGIPAYIKTIDQMPKLQHLQLLTAGANRTLANPAIAECLASGRKPFFTLSTASGIHADSISQYIVGTLLMIMNSLDKQVVHARTKATWSTGPDFPMAGEPEHHGVPANDSGFFIRQLRGKTVGFLGYGHIAREAARLLKAFNTTIIAANTTGTARFDDGFIPSGTGDAEGSIPEAYYSTNDKDSLDAFLARSEILVCSLPSTAATRYILDDEKLALLPRNAILINVGRGDLVSSQSLLTALNRPGGLIGIAIDVTDPEPLTAGHPLWTHPNAIVTPHLSGESEGEFDLGVGVFLENIRRMKSGDRLANLVDWEKGY